MKALKPMAWFLATALVVAGLAVTPASADVDVSFGFFYSNLAPHGDWRISANYGHVWQPAVYDPGWNPYYDGHWVYTDLGWTWVSDYRWGSIPYHYGTWVMDPGIGWCWVPGYVWAPSWVVFRTGPDYIGWAPVPPSYSVGLSVNLVDYDPHAFVFVDSRDFLASRIRTRAISVARAPRIIRETRVVNSLAVENQVVVNRGPDVRTIERATRVQVRPRPIERVARVAPPGGRPTRETLRVDAIRERRPGGDVRATSPMHEREPLPGPERFRGRGKAPEESKDTATEAPRRQPQPKGKAPARVKKKAPDDKNRPG